MIKLVLNEVCDIHKFEKLKILSNEMKFNEKNEFLGFDETKAVHSLNKFEKLKEYPEDFRNKNIILIGDTLQVRKKFILIKIKKDRRIIEGIPHKNAITISFNYDEIVNFHSIYLILIYFFRLLKTRKFLKVFMILM